jgi:hypothetical protein
MSARSTMIATGGRGRFQGTDGRKKRGNYFRVDKLNPGLETGCLEKLLPECSGSGTEHRCSCLARLENSKSILHTYLAKNSVDVALNSFLRKT